MILFLLMITEKKQKHPIDMDWNKKNFLYYFFFSDSAFICNHLLQLYSFV